MAGRRVLKIRGVDLVGSMVPSWASSTGPKGTRESTGVGGGSVGGGVVRKGLQEDGDF